MNNVLRFAGACALVIAASTAQAETLKIATEGAYPPFNYVDSNNQLHGFDVDIANALCKQMQVECQIVAQDWEGIIPALLAKKYDAVVASMIATDERKKKIAFSNHYYRTPLSVAVAKDSDITDAQTNFKGRTVGAQASSTQAIYAEDHYGPAGADVKFYPTLDEANSDLAAGRVDGVIADKFPLLAWAESAGKDCCKIIGDVNGTTADASIAVRKEDNALRERLNKALDAIVADGTYKQISSRYFTFDIY
ncbi:transporter substrate-binding domain-containing protein [Pseudomonas protegens]|uniref:Octopine-binding periplasmic protein OccT n=1 Tax=Pseudomonas protegens (strain DSM 19095 / LMG 27888 / CFBP 6595 / CHA0) TaxID=1124983 RepID=A0A2C9EKA8_PSEPH|nr:transporter substrate-binding domain-containing protein [Pseudomonas protegens]AGL84029.1 octopine-binding periplasmic protein OccT [Pseudomonas protegens CHA0]MBP5113916.1 transporter substrate-binding domain-containing protein [Pseudomonas protegens]QTU24505.1 transporter substrate-binding domain-containing protein [Pseudomonas protegens]QTU34034.1 transporter substrate-binding domain-containing protein [Pseudomonas protegens]RLO20407.1 amino acid ABC transporter [Pseudomonas protegens]